MTFSAGLTWPGAARASGEAVRLVRGVDSPRVKLRVDRVVVRVTRHLTTHLAGAVPRGMTVQVAIAAPIRQPAKAAGEIEDRIRRMLQRRRPGRDLVATIHGNRVRIRVVRATSARASKTMVCVHNSNIDSRRVLDTMAG